VIIITIRRIITIMIHHISLVQMLLVEHSKTLSKTLMSSATDYFTSMLEVQKKAKAAAAKKAAEDDEDEYETPMLEGSEDKSEGGVAWVRVEGFGV
jgi:hypothetical protein